MIKPTIVIDYLNEKELKNLELLADDLATNFPYLKNTHELKIIFFGNQTFHGKNVNVTYLDSQRSLEQYLINETIKKDYLAVINCQEYLNNEFIETLKFTYLTADKIQKENKEYKLHTSRYNQNGISEAVSDYLFRINNDLLRQEMTLKLEHQKSKNKY